jgi:membrane-associated HD superfamily phosphohydrolase
LAYEYFLKRLGDVSNLENVAFISTTVVAIILTLMSVFLFRKLKDGNYKKKDIMLFFFIYLAVYIFISYAVTGLFAGNMDLNHHLYILNIILIFILVRMEKTAMFNTVSDRVNAKKWFTLFLIMIIFIALISVISINTHGELGGSHNRFPIN